MGTTTHSNLLVLLSFCQIFLKLIIKDWKIVPDSAQKLFTIKLRCQSYDDELQGGSTTALVCREICFASSQNGREQWHNASQAHSRGAEHVPARTLAQELP